MSTLVKVIPVSKNSTSRQYTSYTFHFQHRRGKICDLNSLAVKTFFIKTLTFGTRAKIKTLAAETKTKTKTKTLVFEIKTKTKTLTTKLTVSCSLLLLRYYCLP